MIFNKKSLIRQDRIRKIEIDNSYCSISTKIDHVPCFDTRIYELDFPKKKEQQGLVFENLIPRFEICFKRKSKDAKSNFIRLNVNPIPHKAGLYI